MAYATTSLLLCSWAPTRALASYEEESAEPTVHTVFICTSTVGPSISRERVFITRALPPGDSFIHVEDDEWYCTKLRLYSTCTGLSTRVGCLVSMQ